MNILFIGDVFGKLGRKTIEKHLKTIKQDYKINFTIVNGENAAHGRGITEVIYKFFLEHHINVLTMGNHTFDNHDIYNFLDEAKSIVRPANYEGDVPGEGYRIYNYNGTKIAVINLLGRIFLTPMKNPFLMFDAIYDEIKTKVDLIFVDFHAEATSEKIAFGHYVDGRATVVVGTHTHVPTADNRLLPKGTAYITDVGMTGPLNGIIGMEKSSVITKFINGLPNRFNPLEEDDAQLNAVVIEVDPQTKRAKSIKRIQIIDNLNIL